MPLSASTQAGVPIGSVTRLFLTHLHSDHVVQIPDLLSVRLVRGPPNDPARGLGTGWHARHDEPPPTGVRVRHPDAARRRREISRAGIEVASHDIAEGVIFDQGGVKVTAFLVDHGPVQPAFGYRVDYKGRSVVLSGDTRVSENLIRVAKGTDVLIHEMIDPAMVRARQAVLNVDASASIIAHHTTPAQAAEVFNRVSPRLAVYSHAPNTENVMTETRKTYSGPLEGAEDLLTIVIGEKIDVRHRSP